MKEDVVLYIGEYYATTKPLVIGTTLGSCVSVCLYDDIKKIGGMNHILLPGEASTTTSAPQEQFALHAMELLMHGVCKLGAVHENITAKIFGGAHLMSSGFRQYQVGEKNVESVMDYLDRNKIRVSGKDVGGQCIRTLYFYTDSGDVYVKQTHSKTNKHIMEENRLLDSIHRRNMLSTPNTSSSGFKKKSDEECSMYKPVIMIIDENENHRSMMKKIIEPVNARVVEVARGSEGLSAVFHSKPDLVIANIRAPRLDGLELCRRMKDDVSTQNIPVVLVGSNEKDDHIGLGFKAGANAYIEKKEAKTKLLRNVTTLLKQTKSKCEKLILVVDDSSSIREMLLDGLSKEGYRVITADNGKKALDLLQTNHPDLILSDVYMPEMNGLALCETLHSDPYLSTIPFVVMSTENDAGNMKRMMQYGAASFIVKPFNIEQLVLVLEKIFSFQFLILLKEKERLESEQNLLIASIASLANALEARDEYTRGHSERVASILAGLVKRSGGSQAEIDRSLIAGKLHDIGKIGIRDNVLLKPGRLTEEEFDHIKQHSLIGANILQSIPSIADIIPVVASHHERIDGKGYPKGLSGDQIPLWARMTAVADTYDALTSDRPYRKGMPVAKALQIIRDVKGTQLCPDCVDLFITWSEQEDI